MGTNLLRPTWGQLDPHELRILLDNRIGRPGQYECLATGQYRVYLPLAGPQCRIVLTYCDRQPTSIEAGPAFDAVQWDRIADDIETSVLAGSVKIGRDFSFSMYRVQGSWSGARSGVQILPPPPEAPRAQFEMAEHPFILEFPIKDGGIWVITNHRRQREHHKLTLLLNILLAGRTNLQPRRSSHFWGYWHHEGETESRWVQNFFSAGVGEVLLDSPSPLTPERLEEIASDRYYEVVRGFDGLGLRVPDNLDDLLCRYQGLHPTRRSEFDRAAFWLDVARRQWNISVSASFASLVSAVESLINTRGKGSTARFRDFFERYAPGISHVGRRNEMYNLRSGILHGSEMLTIDQNLEFGWDPPGWNERELQDELWTVTRFAMRNWLGNPPPV
ncbi:MAG TPA: hypothetical protein VMF69_23555 [Gemmataceae bacterium]|nr:hypothetical protein [Gemmataceae bacterium]